MLTECEQSALDRLVAAYGLKGVVDALATIASRQAAELTEDARAASWGHDAIILGRTVRLLWTGGTGRS